jgi:hypothetical protein
VVDEHDTGRLYVPKLVVRAAGGAVHGASDGQQNGGGAQPAAAEFVTDLILELEACVVPGSGQVGDACL